MKITEIPPGSRFIGPGGEDYFMTGENVVVNLRTGAELKGEDIEGDVPIEDIDFREDAQ